MTPTCPWCAPIRLASPLNVVPPVLMNYVDENQVCSGCDKSLTKANFSKKQWSKGVAAGRCKTCVENGVGGTPATARKVRLLPRRPLAVTAEPVAALRGGGSAAVLPAVEGARLRPRCLPGRIREAGLRLRGIGSARARSGWGGG